ncbi:MAG: alpha/beta fold hydrolase [Alphaproteobacteria bacterium]|nr:alpha/beta fold hydrolase [Alphaproteobacteria bacterium]MBO6863754.1 alpha/beta fold hydrolase [Alphaproteobacteria bacterium]
MAELRMGSMIAERSGEGPAVVMIHGLGGTSNTFQPQMAALNGFDVLRPDLPGAGRSALRPGKPGLQAMAQDVKDMMRAAGISRAHLVGHSMGTLICQYLAADRDFQALSLTLFGAILEPPEAARAGLKDRAAAAREKGMTGIADAVSQASVSAASRNANPVVPAFVRESLMRQDPAGYAAHCEALSGAQAADHAAIACPTLMIAGSDDPVAPVAMAQELKRRITGATVETLSGIGHWMTMEDPQRSADLLRQHLDAAA